MTLAWIVYALVIGSLLALTARCLEEVCRLANLPARWVWIVALGSTVTFVALAPYRAIVPRSPVVSETFIINHPTVARVFSPESNATAAVAANAARATAGIWWKNLRTLSGRGMTAIDALIPAAFARYFVLAWLVSSAAMLLLFTAVYRRFRRAVRRWPVSQLRGTRVRVAPAAGPAVVGVWQPEIVVPRWLLDRSANEQRLALAHEREHVRAHDPLLLALGCVAVALLPWHPAVWWMFARLRLTVELDCDGRVLRRGVARRLYGTVLIDLAGQCTGLATSAPALADNRSHLRQRILAMTRPHLRFVRTRVALLSTFASVTFVAAYQAQVPQGSGTRDTTVSRVTLEVPAGQERFDRGVPAAVGVSPDSAENGRRLKVKRKTGSSVRAVAPANVASESPKTPTGSISRVSNPIIIVDGVRVPPAEIAVDSAGQFIKKTRSPIDNIDPTMIETIEVFKGASAVTLYGAAAENGVIVITTKNFIQARQRSRNE